MLSMRSRLCLLLIIGFVFIVAVAFAALPSEASAPQVCKDIEKFDFRNSTLELENRGYVTLVHGNGCSSDDLPNHCDWKQEITLDVFLWPQKGIEIRLLRINSDHLTGSGEWDYVLIYECRGGILSRIFERRYLSGVKLERLEGSDLVLRSGHWLPGDANCCPSKEKLETFCWDNKQGTYTLVSTDIRPILP